MGTGEGAEDAIRARAREASPVNHLDRSDPPLLLIQGGKDSLCAHPSQGYGGGGHGHRCGSPSRVLSKIGRAHRS